MKYLICFMLCGLFGQAQVMTRDYGSPNLPSKAVVASLYTNVAGNGFVGSGVYGSINTNERIIPIVLGSSRNSLEYDERMTILGVGYGMRRQFRKLILTGQILPKIWLGELQASSLELNLGVSREYNNNLVLRIDVGPGLWYGDRVDYNHPPDPQTFMYPVEKNLEYFTNYRFSIGYRI